MDSPRPPLADIMQPPQPASQDSNASNKSFLTLIGLFVLALVFAGGYFALTGTFSTNQPEEPPTGLLVLALGVWNEDASAARITPALYDVARDELAYVPVDALAPSPETSLVYQHVLSSGGGYATFLGATDLEGSFSLSDIPFQVYRADISQAPTFDDVVRVLQESSPVTDLPARGAQAGGTGIFRQSPSISSQGDILYMAHDPQAPEALLASAANEWDIHLVSANGADTVVVQGIRPKWTGDDKFVYLKNDGLYLYTLSDGNERKVWGARGTATAAMSLDVSDDYQYLAWVAPETGSVTILRALNWAGAAPTLRGVIPMFASAAVFSPDSRFVAVQSFVVNEPEDAEGGESEVGMVVDYFTMGTLERTGTPLFIHDVDVSQTTLTDWRP